MLGFKERFEFSFYGLNIVQFILMLVSICMILLTFYGKILNYQKDRERRLRASTERNILKDIQKRRLSVGQAEELKYLPSFDKSHCTSILHCYIHSVVCDED